MTEKPQGNEFTDPKTATHQTKVRLNQAVWDHLTTGVQ